MHSVQRAVAASGDGRTIRVYVDGVLAGSAAAPGLDLAAIYNGNDPFIGREFNGSDAGLGTRSFDGSIEQVALFDYALTLMRRFCNSTTPVFLS